VFRVKVAVTPESVVMPNVQSPVPEQLLAEPVPPLHPPKVAPVSAVALRVTDVLKLYVSVQSAPQFIPVAVTVPLPVPALVTVRVTEEDTPYSYAPISVVPTLPKPR